MQAGRLSLGVVLVFALVGAGIKRMQPEEQKCEQVFDVKVEKLEEGRMKV
jgi:hypothetical protein